MLGLAGDVEIPVAVLLQSANGMPSLPQISAQELMDARMQSRLLIRLLVYSSGLCRTRLKFSLWVGQESGCVVMKAFLTVGQPFALTNWPILPATARGQWLVYILLEAESRCHMDPVICPCQPEALSSQLTHGSSWIRWAFNASSLEFCI